MLNVIHGGGCTPETQPVAIAPAEAAPVRASARTPTIVYIPSFAAAQCPASPK